MAGESLAIIVVIIVLSNMLLRAGRKFHAAFSISLVSVPVFHLLGWLLPPTGDVIMALDIAGMAVGIAIAVVLALRMFESGRARFAYLTIACGFHIALTAAYILNIY